MTPDELTTATTREHNQRRGIADHPERILAQGT
jgi:hypothetical protein